jgi:hypothetical protein
MLLDYHERKEGSHMDMIFYSSTGGKTEEKLQRVVESLLPGWQGTVSRTMNDLSERLLKPKNALAIALLVITNKEDLMELLSMSHLFRNTRIIIVAPDRNKDTIALAHQMRPRLLTYTDSDFAEVFGVLNNLIADDHAVNGIGRG